MIRRNNRYSGRRLPLGWQIRLAGFAIVAAAGLWSFFVGHGGGGEVAGRPRVIDGDSLSIAGRQVRLVGIDAPEGRQTCERDGRAWRCGDAARDALAEMAGAHVVCRGIEADQHGRLLGVCEAGGVDLNRRMVADGMAVAYGRYQREEAEARRARRGIWASRFEQPRDWRRIHMRER
ncbi:MAG: thermonuclease family protein [Hyphomicrobiaceae bacterium]